MTNVTVLSGAMRMKAFGTNTFGVSVPSAAKAFLAGGSCTASTKPAAS
ncbi:hypothetical protein [Solimonas soli]|nr:hypothetical protein [Solimonas soli]